MMTGGGGLEANCVECGVVSQYLYSGYKQLSRGVIHGEKKVQCNHYVNIVIFPTSQLIKKEEELDR